jgi:hypothetical protein
MLLKDPEVERMHTLFHVPQFKPFKFIIQVWNSKEHLHIPGQFHNIGS